MAFLTREELLRKRPRRTKIVPLPELGGDVTIKALTEGERSRYEASFIDKEGKPRMSTIEAARRKLIVACAVDQQGNAIFTESDLAALAEQDSAAMSRIYNEARDLSGFTDHDIEELVANFSSPNGTEPPTA